VTPLCSNLPVCYGVGKGDVSMKRQIFGVFAAAALVVIVAVPLFSRLERSGGDGWGFWSERSTPIPSAPMRILPGAVDAPILNHTAIRLGPHDPADILLLGILAGQQTPQATAAIAQWARNSGLTVTSIDDPFVSVSASTKRIEKALRVTINDYRLPGSYTFWANDRGPLVPASLSIKAIVGLSNYMRPSLPGPLTSDTPTP